MRARGFVQGLLLASVATVAQADPPPPGTRELDTVTKPGAAALGAGTIFLSKVALQSGDDGTVYLSQGHQSRSLDQPVGSCRLKLRVPGGGIPAGTPLTVLSVDGVTSGYEDRGISSVRWVFDPNDPAESLLCDTVGSAGPSQGDVEDELRGLLKLESSQSAD